MSWFSELAGKAEAFLERVDQATATTIQNVQSPSRDVSASPEDDINTHIGELRKINQLAKDEVELDSAKIHSMSEQHSMVNIQPKPPKDLARVGHVTPVKYFTPGASKQWTAPPTNAATLSNDSWLEYLNSPTKKQSSDKVVNTVKETVTMVMVEDDKHNEGLDKTDSDSPNKEIPDVMVTG